MVNFIMIYRQTGNRYIPIQYSPILTSSTNQLIKMHERSYVKIDALAISS